MNIANKLTIIDNTLANIKNSIIKKGQTPTGNITTYAEAIENISSGEAHLIGLTVVPSTDSQTILPPFEIADGFNKVYVTPVTNDIDNNIKPENIKKDIMILGVTGSLESGGSGDDEYANYIQIENIIKGTSYIEADEVEAACDDISMFLYGTLHS